MAGGENFQEENKVEKECTNGVWMMPQQYYKNRYCNSNLLMFLAGWNNIAANQGEMSLLPRTNIALDALTGSEN